MVVARPSYDAVKRYPLFERQTMQAFARPGLPSKTRMPSRNAMLAAFQPDALYNVFHHCKLLQCSEYLNKCNDSMSKGRWLNR